MKQLFYILSFIVLVSCTSRTIYKKPDDLIPKDQMIELWTDVFIANSASSAKNIELETKVNYMPLLFEKYGIDSARFMHSNVYYTSRIEDYEKMFREVKENINKIKNKYDPDMADIDPNLSAHKKDSIKAARKRAKNEKKREKLPQTIEKNEITE